MKLSGYRQEEANVIWSKNNILPLLSNLRVIWCISILFYWMSWESECQTESLYVLRFLNYVAISVDLNLRHETSPRSISNINKPFPKVYKMHHTSKHVPIVLECIRLCSDKPEIDFLELFKWTSFMLKYPFDHNRLTFKAHLHCALCYTCKGSFSNYVCPQCVTLSIPLGCRQGSNFKKATEAMAVVPFVHGLGALWF